MATGDCDSAEGDLHEDVSHAVSVAAMGVPMVQINIVSEGGQQVVSNA